MNNTPLTIHSMEIPNHLKNLYRHWHLHVDSDESIPASHVCTDNQLFADITWFIHERNAIWMKKESGATPPFTTDPILSQYRFCNIYRELDRQTIAFHQLLNPLRDNFPLWLLNMFYCRMVARPDTVTAVGLLSFDATQNKKMYQKLMELPRPRYGTPYVFPVSVIMRSSTPTRELFITEHLPRVTEAIAHEIQYWDKLSVYDGIELLIPLFGYNLRFLWTEVLIDVAYQFPEYIDLFKRFPIGPGSLPTMKRINPDVDSSILVTELACIPLQSAITWNGKPLRLSAENWEGIGCEFRKYSNLKAGKGRKRLFKSSSEGTTTPDDKT